MALTKKQLKEIARNLKVTDQTDYQAYLALIYAQAKSIDPSYSYILLSQDLDLGSTNAHSIIRGRRPLTLKAAQGVCKALGLTGIDRKYFLTLVAQARSKSVEERDAAFAERLKLRQKILPTSLDQRQFAFFEHWYHAAILELLRIDDAYDDPQWIAQTLNPSVPLEQVEESLSLLKSLGYVCFDETKKRLYPSEATITTGNEVLGLALNSYHRQMIKLSLDAILSCPFEDRDISALTLAVSSGLKQQLKDEIIALRKRFLQLSAEEPNSTEIIQLNLQLFPLLKKRGQRP